MQKRCKNDAKLLKNRGSNGINLKKKLRKVKIIDYN